MARGDRRDGPGLIGGLVGNVAGAVTPSVVGSLDVNALVEDVDLDAALARVDLDAVIARIDLDAVVERVDLDAALDRVDVNRLLDRVDPNLLLDRVDPNRLLDRVDADRLLDRVDVNSLMNRVDVDSLVSRTSVADIVTAGTTGVAASWLNYVRRIVAAVDTVITRAAARVTRQLPPDPPGPPMLAEAARAPGALTGAYAGPVTRLVGYALDSFLAFSLYTLGAAGVGYVIGLLTGDSAPSPDLPYLPAVLLVLWLLGYYGVSWALTGRTIGMTVVGVRVVTTDGGALGVRQAMVRAVALPLSFVLLGLGFVGLVVGRRRRGLHDVIAGTTVVYDWGDRPAELPVPLVEFLKGRDVEV